MKILIFFLFILAFFFWGKNLGYPDKPYFDEVYYVSAVKEYLKNNIGAYDYHYQTGPNQPYDWTHPPLARLFTALTTYLVGDSPMGWRVSSLGFGFGSLILFYLLSRRLFAKKTFFHLVSTFIFVFDLMPIAQSRIVMSDTNMVFFVIASFLLLTFYRERNSLLVTILLGVTTGGAVATKWNGFFLLGAVMVSMFLFRFKKEGFSLYLYIKGLIKDYTIVLMVALGIYLLSYTQYFLLGANLSSWWELQKAMWNYHVGLKATHDYQASWWSWPLMLRPTWYHVEYPPEGVNEGFRNIYALGNVAIWWVGLLAMIVLLIYWIRKKESGVGLILLGYFSLWLTWAISPRITFIHHYYPPLVFLYLGLGLVLSWLWEKRKLLVKLGILGYLGIVFGMFLYFYPLAVGDPLTKQELGQRFWLKSWK